MSMNSTKALDSSPWLAALMAIGAVTVARAWAGVLQLQHLLSASSCVETKHAADAPANRFRRRQEWQALLSWMLHGSTCACHGPQQRRELQDSTERIEVFPKSRLLKSVSHSFIASIEPISFKELQASSVDCIHNDLYS